jgi:hypothetical protein
MFYRKTPIAARELQVSYWELMGLLRSGRIDPPSRDTSNHFIWTDADLDRARKALVKPKREEIASA